MSPSLALAMAAALVVLPLSHALLVRPHTVPALAHRSALSPTARARALQCAFGAQQGSSTTFAGDDAESETLRVLYDGTCAVCSTNVALLTWFNRRKHRLKFVDISAETYLPEANAGVSYEDAMRHIYVIGPGKQVRTAADAVLAAYGAVGLGWAVGLFRTPVFRWLVDAMYSFVSRNRHALSRFIPGGRRITSFVNTLHSVDSAAQGYGCDDEEECELPYDDDDDDDDE